MVKRPFVTANFGITADGRISTRQLTPADFSSKTDKRRLVEIRSTCDAVLAGSGTVASDNMTMGLPEDLQAERVSRGQAPFPHRVIVSGRGRIDPDLRVFRKRAGPIVIFSTTRMPLTVRERIEQHATVHLFPQRLDLPEMMQRLYREHGVRRLVCEGGARIFRQLLEAGLVDELHLTLTPRLFGSAKAPSIVGPAGDFLQDSAQLRLKEFRPLGDECFLRYQVLNPSR